MKVLDDWISYLKNKKNKLSTYLDNECGINVQDLLREEKKTVFSSQLHAGKLKDLRMACIMDRFTLDSYSPECSLIELTPAQWKEEIDSFNPELIFIESAWNGKDGLWHRKIANGSPELYQMTAYCHEIGVPVVFWNKEDPVYTEAFIPAAQCADFIFTTDIDCIKKYKNAVGHDNVYFLHFAAQPAIHNPIEKYNRKDKFCFAGAYYHKYPNRAKTFDDFAEIFIRTKGLDIYDRNFIDQRPEHAFPERYNPFILGLLDSSEIDVAYKGYNYGINMNSVEQSQTMFARRVFEMLASNTVTVGNYSRGVKNLFGDLTISTNDALTLQNALAERCGDSISYKKYRLSGLRKVLSEHLYEDRLNYIVKIVFGREIKSKFPRLSLFSQPDSSELDRVLDMFHSQTYPDKRLYLLGDFDSVKDEDVIILNRNTSADQPLGAIISSGYIGILNPENYYGKNYLMDLALSFRYTEASGIGKSTYYCSDFNFQLVNKNNTYKTVTSLKIDRGIFSLPNFSNITLLEFLKTKSIETEGLFSIDEFNFCEHYSEPNCSIVDDMVIYDRGLSLREIETIAEKIQKDILLSEATCITPSAIAEYCQNSLLPKVQGAIEEQSWKISSSLENNTIQYLYFNHLFEAEPFIRKNKLNFQFVGNGSLNLLGVCVFYDNTRNKLTPVFGKLNTLSSNPIPENAKFFKLGFRISGSGECSIKHILLGLEKSPDELSCFLSRSNVLILSNQYPAPQELYRNMFVHKRVMAYKEDGFLCDVMRMNLYCSNNFREFEGINIIEGQGDRLGNILENGNIDTVCVHFLDRGMWDILKCFGKRLRILIWLHGAEIQPWWRREYNYSTAADLEKAKIESEERQAFWKEVFEKMDQYNIHFIFVSQYFADEIFEDNKISLPREKYSIIHNCIDTDMFQYIPKSADQRKKILSIRPYASNKYANDLTVKCIEELSKETFFKDLQFKIMGNGDQFEKITAPLKKYANVSLEKRFLRQEEIARLHKDYGIFLTPTRMDAQGVSRDEAMASGLVPVTNAVTAIPEFVDDTCGILAPGENYLEMANGIKNLYSNAVLFLKMSENAAERVKMQSSRAHTILKELKIIKNCYQKE